MDAHQMTERSDAPQQRSKQSDLEAWAYSLLKEDGSPGSMGAVLLAYALAWKTELAATPNRAEELTPKEAERLQRLRDYAYQLQNRLDGSPIKYEMGFTRARLSALRWAIEKISGLPFKPESMRPDADAEAAQVSELRREQR